MIFEGARYEQISAFGFHSAWAAWRFWFLKAGMAQKHIQIKG